MQYFKKFDLFGSLFNFNINRNDKYYKSVIGGITSFLLYSCSLAYFIYKIYLWSSGLILPNITSQPTTFEYQEHTFKVSPIGINMYQQEEDPFDLDNNYVTFFYQQFTATNSSVPKIIQPLISNQTGSSSFISPQNLSLVLNPTDKRDSGQKQQMKGSIYMALCDKSFNYYNITCASDEKLQKFVDKFKNIILWITVEVYDTETKQTQSVYQQIYLQLDIYAPFISQIQFKITEQDSDDNIFITTSEDSKYVSSCNVFTQPVSQTTLTNAFGSRGFGIFQISISQDGNKQKVTYPKLGQILADVGSIMSTLLSISIIAQLINSFLLEEQMLFKIISLYFPGIKNYQIKKDLFGRIKSVSFNNRPQDVLQYQIKFEILKERARNKITFINQLYEMSRLQFIIQGLVNRELILKSHKLGIKWEQDEAESNQQIVNSSELHLEDFTILSLDQLEKQEDIKFYDLT